jgi:hypothetical protein
MIAFTVSPYRLYLSHSGERTRYLLILGFPASAGQAAMLARATISTWSKSVNKTQSPGLPGSSPGLPAGLPRSVPGLPRSGWDSLLRRQARGRAGFAEGGKLHAPLDVVALWNKAVDTYVLSPLAAITHKSYPLLIAWMALTQKALGWCYNLICFCTRLAGEHHSRKCALI